MALEKGILFFRDTKNPELATVKIESNLDNDNDTKFYVWTM